MSANLARAIIDTDTKMLELRRRMDRLALTINRVLMHDDNDRTAMGFHETSDRTNRKVFNCMIFDSYHICALEPRIKDAYIITSETTIGSAIN